MRSKELCELCEHCTHHLEDDGWVSVCEQSPDRPRPIIFNGQAQDCPDYKPAE